jgi:hypothetical protein
MGLGDLAGVRPAEAVLALFDRHRAVVTLLCIWGHGYLYSHWRLRWVVLEN